VALFSTPSPANTGRKFILRIEDTDRERSSKASEAMIFDALSWLGLAWDEGPDKGGPHAPYRQSERSAIYREHAAELVKRGAAYPCFCSRERLDALREEQKARKQNFGYDGHCRGIAPAEAPGASRRAKRTWCASRCRGGRRVHDLLRGDVTIDNAQVDDGSC
jgi:glutamyl-tRNA synthetase